MLNENVHEPPLHVRHATLERLSSDSEFKVHCPACTDGLLLVSRNLDRVISSLDRCISCGQVVVYEDETIAHEKVRRMPEEAVREYAEGYAKALEGKAPKKTSLWDRLLGDEDL